MAPQQHEINALDYASTFPSSLFFPLSLCPSAKKIVGTGSSEIQTLDLPV